MTITTDTKYNFLNAENETFSWTYFDGTSGSCLKHKASGREIYQMQWVNPETGKVTEPVTGETREQAVAFWHELRELQEQKPPMREDDYADPEPAHGQNGYCRKCHSYCWGDCESR